MTEELDLVTSYVLCCFNLRLHVTETASTDARCEMDERNYKIQLDS
jgi:hypothetical protein